MPIAQNLLGLVAMNDEPDRHGHDTGVAADIVRQRDLIAVLDFVAKDRPKDRRGAAKDKPSEVRLGSLDELVDYFITAGKKGVVINRWPDQ